MAKNTLGTKMTVSLKRIMAALGERLRMARFRRKLTAALVAERASCSTATLAKVEKGDPTVSVGIYARVLFALQLEKDLDLLAKDDQLGRLLQDLQIKERKRAPKTKKEL